MTAPSKSAHVLWTPKDVAKTPMNAYRLHVNQKYHQNLRSTRDLHSWSVAFPQQFWVDLYGYLELQPPLPRNMTQAYDPDVPMSAIPQFFPGLETNYAENAMFANPNPNAVALIGIREGMDLATEDGEMLTWHQFREEVRLTASALRHCGIKQGDRVAALVATSIWAMILFHASAAIGAIFTSISPELGLEGCVSRLQQVTPSILFADSDTVYKGKTVPTLAKVQSIYGRLSTSRPRPQVYIVPVASEQTRFPTIDDFMAKANRTDELAFTRVPFNYPLLICYSSGTTGAPKCIVHQHGLLLQLKKISALHNGCTPADVVFIYCSTSWVVFYVMCGYVAIGTATVVYNGSPLFPDAKQLLRIVEKYRCTLLGTSPRYLMEVAMSKCIPKKEFDLSSLRIVYTTGAPLSAEQYQWFYRMFPSEIQLCNTAGGTDTATSLIAGDPCGPIYAGEMQMLGLGMDVDIGDPVTGESIANSGEAGEMIVRGPFPSMPPFFWGDEGNKKYRASYFERFDNIDVWAMHDWLSCNPKTGGFVMHGRSDGVLNPSGIRFGSGEIYAIVEAAPFDTQISNSLCVGRRRRQDSDEEVFLFLVMSQGHSLTPQLSNSIKKAIRQGLSPRHVPKFILEVPEIPTTINGKKVETAVKQILSGKDVQPSATVSNPHSFQYFARFRDLEREPRAAKL